MADYETVNPGEKVDIVITTWDTMAQKILVGLQQSRNAPDVITELESLRFSMNSLARNYGSSTVREAMRGTYDHARTVLDEILLRPMAAEIGSRTVVLVPTGSLHALAWPVLPSRSAAR